MGDRLIFTGAWFLAISMVLLVLYLGWDLKCKSRAKTLPLQDTQQLLVAPAVAGQQDAALPSYDAGAAIQVLLRRSTLHTTIPTRPRTEAQQYTVAAGDSIFQISRNFNLKPESVLWANYDQLRDQPDTIAPGMILNIPPTDGVYYEWKETDTLEKVAEDFESTVDEIVNWSGNRLDLVEPEVKAGQYIMIPNGRREFQTWIVPQIARGKAGVSKSVYGPGACEGSYDGVYGSGGFIWPSANHFLSGNDYWSGHLGVDIAGGTGDTVWASDGGVVVFAGWSTGGYGLMVMIDHGNGYQTVYAHLSQVNTSCGRSVYQGTPIGVLGSTGNSTGSHLHFEIRLNGAFVNPWYVLP